MRARESASICCSPPESVPAGCVARSRRRGKLAMARSMSRVDLSAVLAVLEAAHLEVLAHGERREHAPALGHERDAGARVRACAGSRVTSTAVEKILPLRGSIDPATPRMVVLLPAPLAPISVTISPSATSKDTSRTAGTSP